MTLSLGLFIALVAIMFIVVGASHQYKVGNAEGWRTPDKNETDMYDRWASNIRFQVGDTIMFEYRNDSVVRVDKRGYYHCNGSVSTMENKDGNTVFLLDMPGFFYFVSGDVDHCKRGQRLMVNVLGSRPSPPAVEGPSPSPFPSSAAVSCFVSFPTIALVIAGALGVLSWGPSYNAHPKWI